jgi:hypothetical protein
LNQVDFEIEPFEPTLYGTDEWEKTAFASFRPELRALVDDIRTAFEQENNAAIYIPNLEKVED